MSFRHEPSLNAIFWWQFIVPPPSSRLSPVVIFLIFSFCTIFEVFVKADLMPAAWSRR